MTILWSFSYNSFVKKDGSHILTMLYPDLCENLLCYKGTALYIDNFVACKISMLQLVANLNDKTFFHVPTLSMKF